MATNRPWSLVEILSRKQAAFRIVLCVALSVAIFLIDLQLPLGVAGGVPYVLVVLVALAIPSPRFTIFFAFTSTTLTVLGYLLSDPNSPSWMVIANRSLAVFAIWATALLGLRHIHTLRQLEESKDHFDILSTTAPITTWYSNQDGGWESITEGRKNSAALTEAPGSWTRYLHPEDRPYALATYQKSISGKKPVEIECRLRDSNGQYRWYLVNGVPRNDQYGRFLGYFGSVLDINTRVLAEKRLRVSQSRYRAITENLFIALLVCDDNGMVTACNHAAVKLFGYSENELVGFRICDLICDGQCDSTRRCLSQFSIDNLSGHPFGESKAVNSDNTKFPIELCFSTYYEGDERFHIAAIRDISRQKSVEMALASTRLQQTHRFKMAAIGRLASGLVHEIGNPVSSIASILEACRHSLANAQQNDLPELPEYLDQIRLQVDRIVGVTRDVSDFAELAPRHPSLVSLNDIVERTCRIISYEMGKNGIDLVRQLDPKLPAITIVADHIVQLLLHVLQNAVDACTNIDRPARIVVSTSLQDDSVLLRIADNGCGMPQNVLSQSQDAFFTTKASGRGMGIGLSLCHVLAAENGGDLNIGSTLNQGTTISVTFPVHSRSPVTVLRTATG